MKIQQISSATFPQPNAWVATVMSATAIGRLLLQIPHDFRLFYRYLNFIITKHFL